MDRNIDCKVLSKDKNTNEWITIVACIFSICRNPVISTKMVSRKCLVYEWPKVIMADQFGLSPLTIALDANLAFILFAIKHVDTCRIFKKYLQSNEAYTIFYAKSMELVRIYL